MSHFDFGPRIFTFCILSENLLWTSFPLFVFGRPFCVIVIWLPALPVAVFFVLRSATKRRWIYLSLLSLPRTLPGPRDLIHVLCVSYFSTLLSLEHFFANLGTKNCSGTWKFWLGICSLIKKHSSKSSLKVLGWGIVPHPQNSSRVIRANSIDFFSRRLCIPPAMHTYHQFLGKGGGPICVFFAVILFLMLVARVMSFFYFESDIRLSHFIGTPGPQKHPGEYSWFLSIFFRETDPRCNWIPPEHFSIFFVLLTLQHYIFVVVCNLFSHTLWFQKMTFLPYIQFPDPYGTSFFYKHFEFNLTWPAHRISLVFERLHPYLILTYFSILSHLIFPFEVRVARIRWDNQ